jgi:Family of unknown function (DUF6194)
MDTVGLPAPDPDEITGYITNTFDDVDIVSAGTGTFFSVDPEKHWPNFATLVTSDEFDIPPRSNLARPGVFRLNIGVGRATFERVVGGNPEPDYTEFDRFFPHPDYAKQLWIGIVNPRRSTFDELVKPLLAEAHERVARSRARHRSNT